jgi:hypothetical protein
MHSLVLALHFSAHGSIHKRGNVASASACTACVIEACGTSCEAVQTTGAHFASSPQQSQVCQLFTGVESQQIALWYATCAALAHTMKARVRSRMSRVRCVRRLSRRLSCTAGGKSALYRPLAAALVPAPRHDVHAVLHPLHQILVGWYAFANYLLVPVLLPRTSDWMVETTAGTIQ